jgi:YHS domain-containing protein
MWLRLILILILGYVAFRVYRFATRTISSREQKEPRIPEARDMVRDPVCGMYVSTQDAIQMDYRGQRYSFCSRACLDQFKSQNV